MCDDANGQLPKPSPDLAAAYQVTARLLASEQQTIWNRTQTFFAFNTAAATVVAKLGFTENQQRGLAFAGVLLSGLAGASFYRSWGFRDLFAAVMREQEKTLHLERPHMPLTQGNSARTEPVTIDGHTFNFTCRGIGQRWMSYVVCLLFIIIYGALLCKPTAR